MLQGNAGLVIEPEVEIEKPTRRRETGLWASGGETECSQIPSAGYRGAGIVRLEAARHPVALYAEMNRPDRLCYAYKLACPTSSSHWIEYLGSRSPLAAGQPDLGAGAHGNLLSGESLGSLVNG